VVNDDLVDRIAQLLVETEKAHRQAYLDTDGYDPEWPQWYARHAHPGLVRLLEQPIGEAEIASLLIALDEEYRAVASQSSWPQYYARYLATRSR
jgi:hypothetical protein